MAETVEALLDAFATNRQQIRAACEALAPARRDLPFLGSWSAIDLIAHLIGWDHTNVEALRDIRAGRLPAFCGRYDPDWASYNADLVARYRKDDWAALLDDLWASERRFLAAARRLTDADLTRDRGVRWQDRRVSVGGLLRAALRDEAEHLCQLQAFAAASSA